MPSAEIKPLIGQRRDTRTGMLVSYLWKDIERLYLDGRQIATIKAAPGAVIGLFPGVQLTAGQREAVEQALADAHGARPAAIKNAIELPYEIVDEDVNDDEGDDTETDESDE
jgi:hypothetical protein